MSMTRRAFVGSIGMAACAAGRPVQGSQRDPNRIVKPPRLRAGDTVGFVNPATAAFRTEPINIMTEAFEALGLRVKLSEHYYERHGYFAGRDDERASDVNTLFRDPTVKLIYARGGWGSTRLLPLLDYDAIRANPKIVLGYSDVTGILLGIHAKTGLATFHGPAPDDTFTAEYLRRVVFDGEAVTMENPTAIGAEMTVQTEDRIQTIASGKARGRILGGNLTLLTSVMGSDYVPDFRGSILFLEDVDEQIYRIDRMLTELKLAGILDQIAGFVFGRCTNCLPGSGFGSLTLEQVLAEHVEPLGVPAWRGSMIGHIDRQVTVPIGIEVEIDADAGTIRMLESAVV